MPTPSDCQSKHCHSDHDEGLGQPNHSQPQTETNQVVHCQGSSLFRRYRSVCYFKTWYPDKHNNCGKLT